MPELPTVAHVTLTVSDLERSIDWYERLFDVQFVLDQSPGPFRRAVWLVEGQTLVGLHEFPDPSDDLPFDERRIGLDHLAFTCSGRGDLEGGRSASRTLASLMEASSMPRTGLHCRAVTPTTSHWSSFVPASSR
jgi:catechol 2,3-dioxygenase-like lactoylglutathione lyase family enzyme